MGIYHFWEMACDVHAFPNMPLSRENASACEAIFIGVFLFNR